MSYTPPPCIRKAAKSARWTIVAGLALYGPACWILEAAGADRPASIVGMIGLGVFFAGLTAQAIAEGRRFPLRKITLPPAWARLAAYNAADNVDPEGGE